MVHAECRCVVMHVGGAGCDRWSVLVVGYNFLWPLLAYVALRVDSKFWRRSGTTAGAWKNLGMPLLDTGESCRRALPCVWIGRGNCGGGVTVYTGLVVPAEELNDAVVIDFAQVTLRDVIAVGGTATVYKCVSRRAVPRACSLASSRVSLV